VVQGFFCRMFYEIENWGYKGNCGGANFILEEKRWVPQMLNGKENEKGKVRECGAGGYKSVLNGIM